MDDEMSTADKPQQVTVVFRKRVRPGTPEAQAQGCLCRFESNLAAGSPKVSRIGREVPEDNNIPHRQGRRVEPPAPS